MQIHNFSLLLPFSISRFLSLSLFISLTILKTRQSANNVKPYFMKNDIILGMLVDVWLCLAKVEG